MSISLRSTLRFRIIDRCLRQKTGGWSWEELAQACYKSLLDGGFELPGPPSRRTILGDIHIMRSGDLGYFAPIEYSRGHGYYYSDPDFSIDPTPIQASDISMLREISSWLSQLTSHQLTGDLQELIQKIEKSMHLFDRSKMPIIFFDEAKGAKGREWLLPIYRSIVEKHALQMVYTPFADTPIIGTISCYVLKEYNKRWFTLALHHESEKILTLSLDRISTLEPLTRLTPYREPQRFNPNTWFKDIIGVSRPEKGKLTTVKFHAAPIPYALYIPPKGE
jgi:predicted DNA-binding transcriptional regulator YafY